MNDFDYDVREKKRIASGARARKCGSKSKRCTLPSDYLTAKQKKGLNGEMKTYNLSAPMNYIQFRDMPEDLQKEYLTKLYVDWRISLTEISKMFKCSPETVRHACRQFGISTKMRGQRATNAQMRHWYDWIRGGGSPIGNEEINKREGDNNGIQVTHPINNPCVVSGSIRLEGTSSMLMNTITSILSGLENRKVTVEIGFDTE